MKLVIRLTVALSILSVCLLSAIVAVAGDKPDMSQEQAYVDSLETKLTDLKGRIIDRQEGDNMKLLVEEYLYTALQAVYFAKSIANSNYGAEVARTNDLHTLVDGGYLSDWPQNPLDEWNPMPVLSPSEPFSPGALCLDLCPAQYYTDIGNGPEAMSFQLYVYGVDQSQASFREITILSWNKKWAHPPSGAIYGMSFSAMPAAQQQP